MFNNSEVVVSQGWPDARQESSNRLRSNGYSTKWDFNFSKTETKVAVDYYKNSNQLMNPKL